MKKLLSILTLSILYFPCFSQTNTKHLFAEIDQLNLYDLSTFSKISKIEIELSSKYSSRKFPSTVTGWIVSEAPTTMTVLNTTGQEITIKTSDIKQIKNFTINDNYSGYLEPYSFMDSENEILTRRYKGSEMMPQILVASWLKQLNSSSANLVINEFQEQLNYKLDTMLVHFFGNLYYNELLVAFASNRDRITALKFGRHLSQSMFRDFLYFDQVNLLTDQLNNRPEDFISFNLPDSLSWIDIQKNLTRNERIEYLLDRLRLLNCDQPGQPAWINYRDIQTSISFSQIMDDPQVSDFYKGLEKYAVINPFNELLKMDIQIDELPIFLPYLKSKEFITSYEYWRDFSSHRTLHPVAGVVLSLIYEITDKKFVKQNFFDLSDNQKDLQIQKIQKWITENSNRSSTDRIKEILLSSNDWGEFKNAMYEGAQLKIDELFKILSDRIGDFDSFDWPSPDGSITELMMKVGTSENIDQMTRLLQSEDEWVRLWSSLFFIEFDPTNEQAIQTLREVLDSGDGQSYYPRAIPILLQSENPRLLRMAEGILEKSRDDDPMFLHVNDDILRMLVLSGSQQTLTFLNARLNDTKVDDRMMSFDEDGKQHEVLKCEAYVRLVNGWRTDEYEFNWDWNKEQKLVYSEQLSRWLTGQFERITNGETHYLNPTFGEPNLPHSFIDSPSRH